MRAHIIGSLDLHGAQHSQQLLGAQFLVISAGWPQRQDTASSAAGAAVRSNSVSAAAPARCIAERTSHLDRLQIELARLTPPAKTTRRNASTSLAISLLDRFRRFFSWPPAALPATGPQAADLFVGFEQLMTDQCWKRWNCGHLALSLLEGRLGWGNVSLRRSFPYLAGQAEVRAVAGVIGFVAAAVGFPAATANAGDGPAAKIPQGGNLASRVSDRCCSRAARSSGKGTSTPNV